MENTIFWKWTLILCLNVAHENGKVEMTKSIVILHIWNLQKQALHNHNIFTVTNILRVKEIYKWQYSKCNCLKEYFGQPLTFNVRLGWIHICDDFTST